MSDTEAKIREAAARNDELLKILSETDYVPSAITQQDKLIRDLTTECHNAGNELKKAERSRVKEFSEHERYRDSFVKKWAHHAVGKKEKFAEKAEKEEREYFDALRKEQLAQSQKQSLDKQLEEAKDARKQLDPILSKHKGAQEALDALYNSIFNGPTPAFPDEDNQEQSVANASRQYRELSDQLETERQAGRELDGAANAINTSLNKLESALHYSRVDMFGGGTWTDMMKRSALSQAQNAMQESRIHMERAQRFVPGVKIPSGMQIEQGHIVSDMLFDNIFTDMAMHDKIKASEASVKAGAQTIYGEQMACRDRLNALRGQLASQEQTLTGARRELQRVRQQVFERVGKGGSLPSYETATAS